MASNQKNTYPHFYHNQVLKSSTLNGYFEFLDLQTRLSRVHLVGCGIVDGLTFSFRDGALVLSPGVAINKDGWLVEIREETEYGYATNAEFSEEDFVSDDLETLMSMGGSRIKKICFQTEDDVRQFDNRTPEPVSSLDMSHYVVALAFGRRSEYSSRCSQGSCDLNTTDQLLEAWPVLIETGDVRSLFQKIAPMEFRVSPQKEPCISCCHGTIGSYQGQVFASARLWVSELTAVMSRLSDHLQLIPGATWNGQFPYDSLMPRFAAAIKQVQSLLEMKQVPDYQISFFGDMAMALNEFIDAYNAFAVKYEVIPTRTVSDALVYLGRVNEGAQEDDRIYRSLFRNALADGFRRDGDHLGRMLRRVCVLSESFIRDESDQKLSHAAFRLLRFRTGGPLSSKPAPFYYDSSREDFYEGWNPERLPLSGKAGRAYGYLTGSASMNEEGWSFYPEAYQGKELSIVKSELASLGQAQRLSMDVVEAALNEGASLTKKEADLLRQTLAPLAGKKDPAFMEKVMKECHGDAYKVAGILDSSYDPRLLDALQDGRTFTEEESSVFCGICEMEKIDGEAMTELAQAFLKSKGSKVTDSATKELASALTHFVSAWKGSYISVAKGIPLDELGKALTLAPVRRGCRVYLFTKSVGSARTVLSYGVYYRTQVEDEAKEPVRVKPVFRMRTSTMVNGDIAVEFPDTVCPYGDDGKWSKTGDEISFIPYVYNGSASVMYETPGTRIECQIADQEILKQSRIDILEKKYPSIVLQMLRNGRTLVTLKVMDADNELLNSRSFYVEVDNPAWRKIDVTSISLFPLNLDLAVGEELKLVPDVKPAGASKEVTWSRDNPQVATVSENGVVSVKKEGTVKVTAVSVSNKDKKATMTIQAFSYRFRVKTVTRGDGDYYCDLPNAFNPFGDGRKWDTEGNRITIVPFKHFEKENKVHEVGQAYIDCTVSGSDILQYDIVPMGKSGSSVLLQMGEKNGKANVTLKLLKSANGEEVLLSETFTVEVNNPEWNKTPAKSLSMASEKEMYVNQICKLSAKVNPPDASQAVTWRSENPSIATVNSSTGEVTAVKEGAVKITATSVDGGKSASTEVKIYKIVFSMRTAKVQDNGFFAAPFGDTVKPRGDNGRWAFQNDTLQMYMGAYDGMVEKDLIIDPSLVSVTIQEKKVLSSRVELTGEGSPVLHLRLLKKGKSNVQVTIKDPNGSGKVIERLSFTVDGND